MKRSLNAPSVSPVGAPLPGDSKRAFAPRSTPWLLGFFFAFTLHRMLDKASPESEPKNKHQDSQRLCRALPLREKFRKKLLLWIHARPNLDPRQGDDVADMQMPSATAAHGAVDINMLEELKDILEDEYPNFLGQFLANGRDRIREIHSALQNNDAQRLHRECHTLKGNAATVGAHALSETAQHLEQLAKAGRLDEIRLRMTELETRYNTVHAAIAALTPRP